MARHIDAEKLAEHKFLGVTHERYVSDGRPKSEEEIYAYKVGYNDAIDSIAQFAPTADVPERNVGKWIAVKVGNGDTRYTCSECGASYECDSRDAWDFLFCPKCGAQMGGRREDE